MKFMYTKLALAADDCVMIECRKLTCRLANCDKLKSEQSYDSLTSNVSLH